MSAAFAWIDEQGPLRRLALLRVLVGMLLLRHTLVFLDGARHHFFADTFFIPYVDWLPVPGYHVYVAMLAGTCVAGVFVVSGLFTRVALAVALLLGAWVFLLNQFFYSNNRVFLLLCVLVLLLSPSHRAMSLDAWRSKSGPAATGPLWTQDVLRAQASLLYLASGGSKLVDPDWIGGWVLWTRLRIVLGAKQGIVVMLGAVKPVLGGGAIATEVFLGTGLWVRRTRRPALWIGFWFHFVIELLFSVHVFSYLMLGIYFLVASGDERNRVLRYRASSKTQSLIVSLLAMFDWLAKLKIEPSDRLEAVRPDGSRVAGPLAFAIAGDAVPLAFPLAHPLTWFAPKSGSEAPPAVLAPVAPDPHPASLAAAGLASGFVLARAALAGFGIWEKGVWAILVIGVLTVVSSQRGEKGAKPVPAAQ